MHTAKLKLASRLFLEFLCAENYPEQEPAWQAARWYHLFWLLIPICGFLFFIEAIRGAWKQQTILS